MTDTLLKTLQTSLDDPMDHIVMPKRVLRAVIERLTFLEIAAKPTFDSPIVSDHESRKP